MMIVMKLWLILSLSAAAPLNSNVHKESVEENLVSDDIGSVDIVKGDDMDGDGLHSHSSQDTGRDAKLVFTGGAVSIGNIGNINAQVKIASIMSNIDPQDAHPAASIMSNIDPQDIHPAHEPAPDPDGEWSSYGPCNKICGGGMMERSCINLDPSEGGNLCGGNANVECNTQPCAGVSDQKAIKSLGTTIQAIEDGLRNLEYNKRSKRDLDNFSENELKLLAIISEATRFIGQACQTKQSQCQLKTIEPFVEVLTTIFNMIRSTRKCSSGFVGLVEERKMSFDSVATVAEQAQTGWSNWGNYGECSQDCGIGIQTRTRTCNDLTCEQQNIGSATETKDCNTHHCVNVSDFEDMRLDTNQMEWLQAGLLYGQLGDVIVDETTVRNQYAGSALINPNEKWPNDIVYYSFTGTIASSKKTQVENILSDLQEFLSSCLIFQERNDGNRIIVGESSTGCYSEVGFKGRPQNLNLGGNCWHDGIIQHEFLHAIGIYHTHSRSDRDEHIIIHWNNIHDNDKHNFNKYDEATISHHGLPYDYSSVMHYGKQYFTKYSEGITIETIDPSKKDVIGQISNVTTYDLELVRRAYGYQSGEKCVISPNYPLNYPNNEHLETELSVAVGNSMRITIHDFDVENPETDVENHETCTWDYLEFYDGNSERVGQKLCGDALPQKMNISISTSYASAVFKSDSSRTKKGYKFCYYPVCTADAINEAACFCASANGGEECIEGQRCISDGTCQYDTREPSPIKEIWVTTKECVSCSEETGLEGGVIIQVIGSNLCQENSPCKCKTRGLDRRYTLDYVAGETTEFNYDAFEDKYRLGECHSKFLIRTERVDIRWNGPNGSTWSPEAVVIVHDGGVTITCTPKEVIQLTNQDDPVELECEEDDQ